MRLARRAGIRPASADTTVSTTTVDERRRRLVAPKPRAREVHDEALSVCGFEQAGSECPMQIDRGADDCAGDSIQLAGIRRHARCSAHSVPSATPRLAGRAWRDAPWGWQPLRSLVKFSVAEPADLAHASRSPPPNGRRSERDKPDTM